MRRRMIAVGILALCVIVGITVGVMYWIVSSTSVEVPPGAPPNSSVCDDDVILHLSQVEKDYYYHLQNLLVRINLTDEAHAIDSCKAEHQCLVWMANYKSRDMTDVEANASLHNEYPVIQDYILCLTYLKLDGLHWNRNDGWLEGKVSCSWDGLSCRFLSRVTHIDLPSNGLNGSLPAVLGKMPFLGE